MEHKDFLIGNVRYVLDGQTFDMEVTRTGKKNCYNYDLVERVHIHRLKATELVSLIGPQTQPFLERMLTGNEVMCLVHSKNGNGQIEADVFII